MATIKKTIFQPLLVGWLGLSLVAVSCGVQEPSAGRQPLPAATDAPEAVLSEERGAFSSPNPVVVNPEDAGRLMETKSPTTSIPRPMAPGDPNGTPELVAITTPPPSDTTNLMVAPALAPAPYQLSALPHSTPTAEVSDASSAVPSPTKTRKAQTPSPSEIEKRYFAEGLRLQKEGSLREAIGAYDRVVELNPEHVQALFHRGLAHRNLGELQQAIESFDQAIQRDSPEC